MIRRLFRLAVRSGQRTSNEAAEELDALMQERVDYLVARGMSRPVARAEAMRRLGTTITEAHRAIERSAQHRERRMHIKDRIGGIAFDLRLAARGIVSRPAFSLAVALTVAIGIASTTAVFSVVHGVLLRPLPYPEPDRVVRIFETGALDQPDALRSVAIPTLHDWRANTRTFDAIGLYGPSSFDIGGSERPERVQGVATSAALFTILGARPMLGRVFAPEEERPGGPLVVVLSHALWQRRFGGDSSVVGRTIRIDRTAFTVIGVMPPEFRYPDYAEMWASLATDHEFDARAARHMSAIGKLAAGVSVESATRDLMAEEQRLGRVYPQIYANRGVRIIPLTERTISAVRPLLGLLTVAVAGVLLIACVNVANLLVVRASSRRREIAVRAALGAGRARIIRHVLLETGVLFTIGGSAGIGVAWVLMRAVRTLPPEILPRAGMVTLSPAVVGFAVALTALVCVVFGLAPAMRTTTQEASLLGTQRWSAGNRRERVLHSSLIVTETALAALLLVGSGLLLRSMHRLNDVDPGFSLANALTFTISYPSDRSQDRNAILTFFDEVRNRIGALAGVTSVAMASRLPMSGADHSNSFRLAGDDPNAMTDKSAQDRAISPGYFSALGIPMRQGREFTGDDRTNTAPVIIVNEAFARRYFPARNAIGEWVTPTRAGGVPRQIVGIAGDARQFGLAEPAVPEYYIPHSQDTWPFMYIAARTSGSPMAMLGAVQRAVWTLDRESVLDEVHTMEQMASDGVSQRRLVASALSAFAAVAYLLAAIGLYGVIAFAVAQRTREIGVRVALGAQRRQVIDLVLRRGVVLAATGAAVGLAGAAFATRGIQRMLYGVGPYDPLTMMLVAVLVVGVAIIASVIPARRAVRIDPVITMRAE